MLKIITSAIFLFLIAGCSHSNGKGDFVEQKTPTQIDWPSETKHALDLLHQHILEMHPAFVTQKELTERAFLDWFEKGYQQALLRANGVKDFAGLYFTLRAYTVGFEDEHLSVGLSSVDIFRSRLQLRWPGFIIAHDGQSNFIVKIAEPSSAEELPPVGAQLESCDGIKTAQLLANNVFPYFGSGKIQKNWKQFGPRLFVDMGNPFIRIPESCTFLFNNEKREYQLTWKSIAFDNIWGKLTPSPPNSKAKISTVDTNTIWISLPSFAPDREMEKDLKSIFSDLPKYRTHSRIVIDLRGNTGGSSSWGAEFLKSLYSPEFIAKIDQKTTRQEVYEYRVTEKIAEYFSKLLGDSSKNIKQDNAFFTKVNLELQSGLSKKLKSMKIPMGQFQSETPKSNKSPVNAKVFVITDEMCFSACLSFMDTLIHIPGTTHIGRVTSADTVFMQTTNELSLLNGDLSLSVPVLRIHNRMRKNNQPYKPKYIYQGDISDSQKLQKWVLTF